MSIFRSTAVAAAALLAGAAALPAQTQAASQSCKPPTVLKHVVQLQIDGLTGAICPDPTNPSAKVFPGDTVRVTVVRADLIHFGYQIRLTDSLQLSVAYGVLGLGRFSDNGPLAGGGEGISSINRGGLKITSSDSDPSARRLATFAELVELYTVQAALHIELLRKAAAQSAALASLDNRIADQLWNGPQARDGNWPPEYAAAMATYLNERGPIALSTASASDVTRMLHGAMTAAVLNAETTAPIAANIAPLQKSFEEGLAGFAVQEDSIRKLLGVGDAIAARWSAVMASHPTPTMQQDFVVRRADYSYSIQVRRFALAPAFADYQKTVAGGTRVGPATSDTSVIGALQYESHGRSRFNVAMGLVRFTLPESRTYGLQTSIGSGGLPQTTVQETASTHHAIKPVITLGVYPVPVDDLDRPDVAFTLNLGTELSTSPSYFLFGGALDFKMGMLIGGGVTTYSATALAGGWKVGQIVPTNSDGTSVVTSVPTHTRTTLGSYVFLGFRPSIFGAFWRLLK